MLQPVAKVVETSNLKREKTLHHAIARNLSPLIFLSKCRIVI